MKKRWSDLSPRTRKAILIGAAVDTALKAIALRDLKGRSDDEVNGSKKAWRISLAVINSAGVLPVAYWLRGRRRT